VQHITAMPGPTKRSRTTWNDRIEMDTKIPLEGPVCPLPLGHKDLVVIGHGSGGRMTHDLIRRVFMPRLSSPPLEAGNDSARLKLPPEATQAGRLAVSTDSHVVTPLFFPGGDIGRLAICGTVNDVSMSGATPLYLTAGFILEEGLPVQVLEQVVESMQAAAQEAGIQVVAGDTKVVEKGKADGLFITTAGVGWIPDNRQIGGEMARPGDIVLISGTLGDHGIAVLAARGELGFETEIQSDVAPLNHMVRDVLAAAPNTHVLRDPTRGGLATTLNEIAVQSNVSIRIEEKSIPVLPAVRAACEMLGFDPLYVANEGKLVAIVPPDEAEAALEAMRSSPYGVNAVRIGMVQEAPAQRVLLQTLIGATRLLDLLSGEMLPRIC
jgi:hydrogenase expression/formation protein HypE